MKIKFNTIKVGNIIGSLYIPSKFSNLFLIHLKGGPSFGDYGNSPFKDLCDKFGFILFVPDYIGYCRSSGDFNYENCLKTIELSETLLTRNYDILKKYSGEIDRKKVRTMLIGSSWGGAIAPLYFKYYKTKINYLCLFRAVLDWKTQGKSKYIEDKPDDIITYINSFWKNIYRNFNKSNWIPIMKGDRNEYNPLNNVQYLNKVSVYITHGKKDTSINWRKSLNYFNNLKNINKNSKIYLLKSHGHTDESNVASLKLVLKDINK